MLNALFSAKKIQEFEELLKQNNAKQGLKSFFEASLLESSVILLFGFALLAELQASEELFIAFPIIAFAVPLLGNYFFQLLKFEKRKREIEEAVPDVLLQAASLPNNANFSNIAEYLARQNFGALSREFEKARVEISKGASVQEALRNISKRCRSSIVERMARLLTQGFESGADLSLVFRETAEDLIETRTILRERKAALTVQKLTLLFAGALIVPLVLGLLVGLVKGFDFESIADLGIGLQAVQRKELFNAALTANQAYIIEYAVIASVFVALIDNDLKKSIIYALALVPASLLAYGIASIL